MVNHAPRRKRCGLAKPKVHTDSNDTIAAVATPAGRGGIGIIRVSGPQAEQLLQQTIGRMIAPRQASFTRFLDHNRTVIDEGIVLWFKGPDSFTGEDLFELHAHGSPIVLDLLLQTLIGSGARLAQPGEFSRRAFESGKYDLSQLEAIAELINSSSARAARCAQRVVQGEFSMRINRLTTALRRLRVAVEASIDFADEDIEHATAEAWHKEIQTVCSQLAQLRCAAAAGVRLSNVAQAVIVGCPNAGKSSLLNRLARRDVAIVSDIAGTTRDILTAPVTVNGMTLSIADTAGLRNGCAIADDAIEREGIRRAQTAAATADLVLVVIDATADCQMQESIIMQRLRDTSTPCLWVLNKMDTVVPARQNMLTEALKNDPVLISAKTGKGMFELNLHLGRQLGLEDSSEDVLIARRRHLTALDQAAKHLHKAVPLHASVELFAEELRLGQTALEAITGETTTEDLLGEIFATFCIGK